MRPDLSLVIENEGIEGAISFLQNVGCNGIQLSKNETDALAELLSGLRKE
jgi:hypothetical protein